MSWFSHAVEKVALFIVKISNFKINASYHYKSFFLQNEFLGFIFVKVYDL